jgi:Zn finger protein HypA/HybF involved in hydrogenase expression
MALLKVKPVKVICRNCKGEAFADDFKLNNLKGIMVCPNCDKKPSLGLINETVSENGVSAKPAGWDEVDDYLEKVVKVKEESFVRGESSGEHVFYVCKKCEYNFRYNTIKKYPQVCPSCGRNVDC